MAAKKMSLEECFESLDDIILELQSGELSLEDSFKKYEDGMKLIKKCNETIDKVEKKLTVVERAGKNYFIYRRGFKKLSS